MARALLIRPGSDTLEVIDLLRRGKDHYAGHIHELIGDHFSLAFHFWPHGHRRPQIVAYCDDMGAYKTDLGWSCVVNATILSEPWPIRGPLLISAADREGNTVPLSSSLHEFLILHPPMRFDFPGGHGFMGDVPPVSIAKIPVLARRK